MLGLLGNGKKKVQVNPLHHLIAKKEKEKDKQGSSNVGISRNGEGEGYTLVGKKESQAKQSRRSNPTGNTGQPFLDKRAFLLYVKGM